MNNKGFAISTMLYGLIIIIALVMMMILSTMAFNRKTSKEYSSNIVNELETLDTRKYDIKVGEYIKLSNSTTEYAYSGSGTPARVTVNPSLINLWRVLKIDSNEIVAVSHYASPYFVSFYGYIGYTNYVNTLNSIAKQYENSTYTKGSRIMGYNGQIQIITTTSGYDDTPKRTNCSSDTPEMYGGTDEKYKQDTDLVKSVYGSLVAKKSESDTEGTEYLLPSRKYIGPGGYPFCNYRIVKVSKTGEIDTSSDLRYYNGTWNNASAFGSIRPILLFKPDIKPKSGNGTLTDPYVIN